MGYGSTPLSARQERIIDFIRQFSHERGYPPTLREIEHTSPYMHDGRFKALEEVVEHYDKGGIKNPWLDQRLRMRRRARQRAMLRTAPFGATPCPHERFADCSDLRQARDTWRSAEPEATSTRSGR